MKKLFYCLLAALSISILSLSFTSCGGDDEPSSGSGIVGIWVRTQDPEKVNFYWKFTNDSIYYYEVYNFYENERYATYKNGYLYVPNNIRWILKQYHKYSLKDGYIFVQGINVGSVKKVDNNKYIFDSDYLKDGVVERVKEFKTISE